MRKNSFSPSVLTFKLFLNTITLCKLLYNHYFEIYSNNKILNDISKVKATKKGVTIGWKNERKSLSTTNSF